MKSLFWILLFTIVFYVGLQTVPIFYRGIIGIRGICKENADVFHKYGKRYIHTGIDETLRNIGIPKDKSKFNISVTDKEVFIWIYYRDTINFFDYYTKDVEFNYECEGVKKSVY